MVEPILMAWVTAGIIVECIGGFYEALHGNDTRASFGPFMFNTVIWPVFLYEVIAGMKMR
jgi:hypothetical protein